MDLNYINISDEILATIQETQPYYSRYVIPAGTYDRQTEDINTITCEAVLYCRADLDEDTVSQITTAFYESAEDIRPATAQARTSAWKAPSTALPPPFTPALPSITRRWASSSIPAWSSTDRLAV